MTWPPPTQRLDRLDSGLLQFTAEVTALDGNRVALHRSAFYPESGGQPADVGRLHWADAQAEVTDVHGDGGLVWHTLSGPVPGLGTQISGEVDARVRWRHMQRHTGEHLLAQAFVRVNPAFGVEAVSMRSPLCTLDLRGQPSEADARAAEDLLMAVIARNLPVRTFEVSDAELGQYPLRRAPKVSGLVRLVGVHDQGEPGGWWEMSACGGTHLPSTAFVAPVVVLDLSRSRGGLTRVGFMAGDEATEHLRDTYGLARQAAQQLSVPVERLPDRVEDALTGDAALRRQLDEARNGWASALVQAAPVHTVGTIFLRTLELPDSAMLTPALQQMAQLTRTVGVAYARDGRCGVSSSLADHPAQTLLRQWLAEAGGRGGGKDDLAQGQTADLAKFLTAVETWPRAQPG